MSVPRAVALLCVAGLVGCDGDEVACTLEARSSVTVTVVDEVGTAIPDPTVTYAVDGGAEQACEAMNGVFVCGYEVEGFFEITADAEGFAPETATVTVESDACHVIGQQVEITLRPG